MVRLSERTLSGQEAGFAQDAGSQSKIELEGEIKSIQFSLEEYSSKIEVKGSIYM